MILIICVLIFGLIGVGFHVFINTKRYIFDESIFGGISAIGYTLFGISAIAFLIVLPLGYCEQIDDYNLIKQYSNQEEIYKRKCDIILPELQKILLNKYPQFEKDIYNKITTNNYQVYLVKYPELMNIEATKVLVDNMNNNYNSIYDMELKIEEAKKRIRSRTENLFFIVSHYSEVVNE